MPIMHAARTQTVLKIIYKGEERMVEPYSLKYQQRRDGVEREYFFAHKISGGESEPGIKRFVAEHMQSIENTETKFEPRHQIELSKAGEMPEDRYVFDPNRPVRTPRARVSFSGRASKPRRSVYTGIKYIYNCSYCGKQSIKTSMDSTLRAPHKGKNGYSCNGTFGIYMGTKY